MYKEQPRDSKIVAEFAWEIEKRFTRESVLLQRKKSKRKTVYASKIHSATIWL